MKRPSTLLRLVAVLGLITVMFAGVVTTAAASPPPSGGMAAIWDRTTHPGIGGFFESDQCVMADNLQQAATAEDGVDFWSSHNMCDGSQEVYFASVASGDDVDGAGAIPAYSTTITVQNLDYDDAYAFIYVGGKYVTYAYLSGGASKTFSAESLGIGATPQPVVVGLYHVLVASTTCTAVATGGFLCTAIDAGTNTVYTFTSAVDLTAGIAIGANAAGVAKQVAGTSTTANTTADDVTVSGYNAVSGREVGFFDQLYLPIVQTNCGPGGCWDTRIDVANVGIDQNAAATLVFFPANDASGSLNTGFQIETDQSGALNSGDTMTVTLSDYVPEGWVGSVHILTDDAVIAIANRFKSGTQMWITNTASNASSESDWQHWGGAGGTLGGSFPYALFAPDVRMDYNGWNTGINVANTVDEDNQVNIQYFGNNGNAGSGLTQRLAAQGMTYFYNPSDPSEDDCQQPAGQVPTCDFVGAAVILSEYPVAVAVDGVKYFGQNADDQNIGQAFTYSATGNIFNLQAMPLVQKGNPANGMGATSGINFLNPNPNSSLISVRWVNPSGFTASNFGNAIVYVPGFSTGFVYTMFQQNLPNGFRGSALVTSTQPIAATSANVDYAVQADGTTVWNLYNPCGFFRQIGDCAMAEGPGPGGNTGQIVKTVVDEAGNPVAGITIDVSGAAANGDTFGSQLVTNAAGQASFVVPFGTFDLTIPADMLPVGFTPGPVNPADTGIVVDATHANVAITDVVNVAMGTKTIDTAKPGALICVFGPGGTAQDPKAPAVPGPCYPFNVFEKGTGGGGQGQPTTFGASLNSTGATASLAYTDATQVLSWNVNIPGLAAGTDVAATFVGAAVCAVDFTGTADFTGFEILDLGSTTANGDMVDVISGHTQLDATDITRLGAFDAGVVVIYDTLTGAVLGCGNVDAGAVREATTAEIMAAFGAAAVQIADGNGDATFTLPAGCYVAVTYVPNHMAATEPFCLAPGDVKTDTVEIEPVTGPVFGTLTKVIDVSAFDPFIGGAGDDFVLQSEIAFCNISTLNALGVNTTSGANIAASGECDDVADPAVEAYGGFDNLYSDIAPTFQMTAQVPVGDYAICITTAVTGPFIPGGPNETLTTLYHCEIVMPGTTAPIAVTAGHETVVMNDAAANALGSLDVFVRSGAGAGPLADAQVCLFDQAGNLVDCGTTGPDGTVHFAVMSGTYTATATAMGFGSLSATCVYDVLDDAFGTGAAPTSTCNVGVAAGVVDSGTDSDIILTLAPVNGTLVVNTTITVAATAPAAGTLVFAAPATAGGTGTNDVAPADVFTALTACGVDTTNPFFPFNIIAGSFAAVTTNSGQVTFSVPPGTYCVIGDPNKDGLTDFAVVTVPSGGTGTADLDDLAALQIDVQVTSTDPGEPGGVTVTLYEVDCATQIGDSATTGADGAADFGPVAPAALVADNYCVQVENPNGLDQFYTFVTPAGDPGGDVDVVVDITG